MPRLGLISDTHGLLRPEARAALGGCDRIVHAGDIGNSQVLEQLTLIAPVDAVRGNNDRDAWADGIPDTLSITVEGVTIHVLHDLAELDAARSPAAQVVVTGHSHKPVIAERDGVLYVNPGSAGPRRFRLPVSVAHLDISGGQARATIIELAVATVPRTGGASRRRSRVRK
jgi:putative phosphoesterase